MNNLFINIICFLFPVLFADSTSMLKENKTQLILQLDWIFKLENFLVNFVNSNVVISTVVVLILLLFMLMKDVIIPVSKIIDFFCKLTQKEFTKDQLKRYRRDFLDKLRLENIERRNSSLRNLNPIDLDKQTEAISKEPWNIVPEDGANNIPVERSFLIFDKKNNSVTQLETNQNIIELFDNDDIQKKLLILGKPGVGKTNELLSLSKDLIQQAIEKENAPIPVIFELSTWKDGKKIRDWLIEQLNYNHKGIPKQVAKQWIDNRDIIPLLDGLDELGSEKSNKCIGEINKFLEENSLQPGLVVCCRQEDYEQAEIKLEQLKGAIYLQTLSKEKIEEYLKTINRWSIWDKIISQDRQLLEICNKPLFLMMLLFIYPQGFISDEQNVIKDSKQLFEAFINRQLCDTNDQSIYSQEKTLHYLVWLAQKLEEQKGTVFSIEAIQPTWLESTKQRNVYRGLFTLIFGLIFGVGMTLFTFGSPNELTLVEGLESGFYLGFLFSFINKIVLPKKLNFSLAKVRDNLNFSLVILLGCVLGSGLREAVWGEGLISGLIGGLIGGTFFGLMMLLLPAFSFSNIEDNNSPDYPSQGIYYSLKIGLIVGLIMGIIFGLPVGLSYEPIYGITFGLGAGLLWSLITVLLAVIQHSIVRFILYWNGDIPIKYHNFLDYAAKKKLIIPLGGSYKFMHDLLRKHFAQIESN